MRIHHVVRVLTFSVLYLLFCAPVGLSPAGAQELPLGEWSYCDQDPEAGLPLHRPSGYATSLLDREGLSVENERRRRRKPHQGLDQEAIARILLDPGF